MLRLSAASAIVLTLGLITGAPTGVDGAKAQDMPPPDDSIYSFDDFPREDLLEHPDWFKTGFLDLPNDLEEAIAEDKQG